MTVKLQLLRNQAVFFFKSPEGNSSLQSVLRTMRQGTMLLMEGTRPVPLLSWNHRKTFWQSELLPCPSARSQTRVKGLLLPC